MLALTLYLASHPFLASEDRDTAKRQFLIDARGVVGWGKGTKGTASRLGIPQSIRLPGYCRIIRTVGRIG